MSGRTPERPLVIDGCQYSNWSEPLFRQMRQGGLDALVVTVCYHEDFRETVENLIAWNRRFEAHGDLIFQGESAADVRRARAEGRTAVFFGLQNCSPIEDDIGLIEVLHRLGVRFMQLSYNNQSLLATGCYEAEDPGITRMGREAIREMNRVGLVVDMSHSAERSTLEAIELSERPIAITHANPAFWHEALRNKSDRVIAALAESGGMLGFSLYPHHLKDKSDCTLQSFCEMAARTVERFGLGIVGFGSDLCQDQPDSVVEWMRNGTWTRTRDFGEGSAGNAGFPAQPGFFRSSADFPRLLEGLRGVGFSESEVAAIAGGNWLGFFERSFGPAGSVRGSLPDDRAAAGARRHAG